MLLCRVCYDILCIRGVPPLQSLVRALKNLPENRIGIYASHIVGTVGKFLSVCLRNIMRTRPYPKPTDINGDISTEFIVL